MPRVSVTCAILAACAAIVVAAVSFVPLIVSESQLPGWRSLTFGLAAATGTVLALPVHVTAVRRLSRGLITFHAGVSLTLIALIAWSAFAVSGASAGNAAGDELAQRATAVAVVAALGTATEAIRMRARTASRINTWAAPIVIAAAVAAGVIWSVVSDAGAGWRIAMCVLAAAIPTTAALAHYTTTIFGRGHAGQIGVDVSAINDIGSAAGIKAIILDAHGTVATGELAILDTHPYDEDHKRNLGWFAGALELQCTNRIGRALGRASGRGRVTNFQYVDGRGALGSVDRHPVRVGRADWIGICDPGADGTVLAVEVDGNPLGYLVLDDEVRPHASKSLQRLSRLGVEPVLISLGSDSDTGRLAARCEASRWHGGMTADAACRLAGELRAEHGSIGFAGLAERYGSVFPLADMVITENSHSTTNGHKPLDQLDVRHVADTVEWCQQMVRQTNAASRLAIALMIIAAGVAAAGAVSVASAAGLGVLGAALVTMRAARVPASLPQRHSAADG